MASKVALITGGARGLGKAFAEQLLNKNCKVGLLDINAIGAETSRLFNKKYGQDQTMFLNCDVTNSEQLANAFKTVKEKYGRLDIVINNAGISNEKKWEAMININLKAVIEGTNLGIELMRKDKGGHGGVIINIASAAGVTPMFGFLVYTATKHGVVGLSRSTAWTMEDMKDDFGISVLCLCPTFAKTDMVSSGMMGVPEYIPKKYERMIPKMVESLGIMNVEEVTDAFEQILEDNINGAVMYVSRGVRKYVHPRKKSSKL